MEAMLGNQGAHILGGVAESPRHKSGIAVRFSHILCRRKDKTAAEVDTLASAQALRRRPWA
jgi:DNA ligase 1